MSTIENDSQAWIESLWQKIEAKLEVVIERTGTKIPYSTKDGMYVDKYATDPTWWTNGFWGGIIMLMYKTTEKKTYLDLANQIDEIMDEALMMVDGDIHHDVGFMWYLSSGLNYQLTKDIKAGRRTLMAANLLSSRFSTKGGFLVAWNGVDRQGWSIIDSMMNIPLLFFATEETGYTRYRDIAIAHADKTLENFIRPDGSVNHIVVYDHDTGEKLETRGGQGYGVGSSWTRGQGWAINGFAQAYHHTGDEKYLNASKKVAHYFLASVAENNNIPLIDFRSPKEPKYIDTTAGVIAASGLIDLATMVTENESNLYLNGALKILKALEVNEMDFSLQVDAILRNGSEAYKHGQHMDIIYGDYYLMEAVLKLRSYFGGSQLN